LGELTPAATGNPKLSGTLIQWIGTTCWFVTVGWAIKMGMGFGGMPGTMGMPLVSFLVMWTLMMGAMMLPSMAPLATLYGRTISRNRRIRLTGFGAGYVLAWGMTGFIAYFIADRFGNIAATQPVMAQVVAVVCFATVGLYQLTSIKTRCLRHCRSPMGHLMHYAGFRGVTKDLRAGLHHGLFCLGCCWALMILMIGFGVMNIAAMVGLALIIAIEKRWRHGETFAKAIGVAAIVWALVIAVEPGAAPGLDPGSLMSMGDKGSHSN